jgi:hypothetical protein
MREANIMVRFLEQKSLILTLLKELKAAGFSCGFFFSVLALSGLGCTRPNYATPTSQLSPAATPSPTSEQNPAPQSNIPVKSCSQEWSQLHLCMHDVWIENPVANSYSSLHLEFGKQVSGNQNLQLEDLGPQVQLTAQLWMPAMGHGGPRVQVDSCGTGCFNLSKIYFIMPGTWEIRLKALDSAVSPAALIDQFVITLAVGS